MSLTFPCCPQVQTKMHKQLETCTQSGTSQTSRTCYLPLSSLYVLVTGDGVWQFEEPIAGVVSFKRLPIRVEVICAYT